MEFNQEKYEELLAAAGLVKKEPVAELTEEQRVEKIKELVEALAGTRITKDERLAKKIRRILRKKYHFKISDFKKVVIS